MQELGKWLAVVVFSILGGISGGATLGRPDPFYGQQGDALRARLELVEERIVRLENRVDELPPDWFRDQFDEVRQEVRKISEGLKR